MTDHRGSCAQPAVFVVVVADPVTNEVDAYGPFGDEAARGFAARRRAELDSEGLNEVLVVLAPLR